MAFTGRQCIYGTARPYFQSLRLTDSPSSIFEDELSQLDGIDHNNYDYFACSIGNITSMLIYRSNYGNLRQTGRSPA